MRNTRDVLFVLAVCTLTPFAGIACDDDELQLTGPGGDDAVLVQVDRFGLPAINTAFNSSSAVKDDFNRAAPADDEATFSDDLVATIMARYGLNEANAMALADIVLPDVQPLGDLSGALFNGRRLTDDVIDTELGVLFGSDGLSDLAPVPALASDNVDANDVPFLNEFPFLAAPHTP